MSDATYQLIKDEIAGKDSAIGSYDEMLWKVRTGFIAILYGAFTLVLGLTGLEAYEDVTGIIAILLISGFTISAGVLDIHLLRSKFRVVQAKEELVDLALSLSEGGTLEDWTGTELKKLLHNSGEGVDPVDWTMRPAVYPFLLIYIGTWTTLVAAVVLLA
jgi:hypothetical protein